MFSGIGAGDVTPQRTPGGTLHNDFEEGKDYRDVYVENWGSEPLIVRVRLSEYMEIGEGAGNRNGVENNQAVSIIDGASIDDVNSWTRFNGDLESGSSEGFRNYWNWTMGGQKLYFPAPEDLRGRPDANGVDFVSTTSPVGTLDDDIGLPTIYMITLESEVISMDEWISRDMPIGNYWVVDTDGFSYWAAPLAPGDATGLLLHKVELANEPAYDFYYAINVEAHMATVDDEPDNYQRLLLDASSEATTLVNRIADRIRDQEHFEVMNTWRSHLWLDWDGAVLFQSRDDINNFVVKSQEYFRWIPEANEFLLGIDDAFFNERAVLFVSANQSSGAIQANFRGVRLNDGVLEVNLHTRVPGGWLTTDTAADIFAISIDRSMISENVHLNHTVSWPHDRFNVMYTGLINQADSSLDPIAFQSRSELQDFFTDSENQAWLDEHTVEFLRGFDDAFFNDRAVVLVSSLENSSANSVYLEYVHLNGGVMEVRLTTFRPYGATDQAMANRFFVISIDRSLYSETTRAIRSETTLHF